MKPIPEKHRLHTKNAKPRQQYAQHDECKRHIHQPAHEAVFPFQMVHERQQQEGEAKPHERNLEHHERSDTERQPGQESSDVS